MGAKIIRKFLLKDDSLLKFLTAQNVKFIHDYKEHLDGQLCKHIYGFKLNNNQTNIEIYGGDFSGLCMLEITFNDELYGVFFKTPEFLNDFIECEVTDKSEFSEQNLLKFGLPNEKFDLCEIFYILKNHDLSLNYPSSIRVKDAVAVLLFTLNLKIIRAKERFLSQSDPDDFIKIFLYVSQSIAILEFFIGVFDEKTTQFFLKNFKELFAKLEQNSQILSSLSLLEDFKNSELMIYFLEHALTNSSKNVSLALQESLFLKDWEVFLSDTSDFFRGENSDEKLSVFVSKQLRLSILECLKSFKKLDENSKNIKFYEILDRTQVIGAMFENFNHLFNLKKPAKLNKKLKNKLLKLYDLDILLEFIQKAGDSEQNDKLKAKIYSKIYKIREKILNSNFKNQKLIELKKYYQKA
ncbi:hypothetical protein [Campylobacter mucosalis]|uniref:hypothetical protein n=1 Tax=Campylobacter mucosalis TaxID=202 RepID=UPI001470846F|nr:hypothetical protein [Campylobacter mucosalis]